MEPLELIKKDHRGNVVSQTDLDIDEQYRPKVNLVGLAKLKPIFGSKTCTAGNAPGMNDGAAAQIIMKRETADKMKLEPLYTIVATASIALQPRIIPVSPAFATNKCLDHAGLAIDAIKSLEINEAFACVPLVSCKLLSNDRFLKSDYQEMVKEASGKPILDNDEAKYLELKGKLNVNGSAIATGHANTASGARIMMTAAYNLKENGGGYAACAICGGLTQGAGAIIWVD